MSNEKIKRRYELRGDIFGKKQMSPTDAALLLISESLDDHLAQRIESDKRLEGILKDIQGHLSSMAELNKQMLTPNSKG